jgi:hypothetical protein
MSVSNWRTELLQAKSDPNFFVRQFLSATPEQWQAQALDLIGQKNKLAIRSGHGVGKSAYLSWTILWFLFTHYPARIAVTAPTSHQLTGVLWPELAKWAYRLPEVLKDQLIITNLKATLKGSNNSTFAIGRTSRKEKPEALQGIHGENTLFIIDEASGVDDAVFEVAEGALTTPRSKVIMCGNPTRTEGYFFNAFHRSAKNWTRLHVRSFDSSQVSTEFIEEMQDKYGEDSNVYRVRVLGEFPLQSEDTLFEHSMLEAATQKEFTDLAPARLIWGLDVARFGSDRTALAKRSGQVLLEPIQTWRAYDTMQTAGRVAAIYEAADRKPDDIYVDAIGIGAGVADRLRELGFPAYAVNVGERASKNMLYNRLRDELFFRAKAWFEAGASIPEDLALMNELSNLHYAFLSNGKMKVEEKASVKKRLHASPDLADAFALTFMRMDDNLDSPPNIYKGRSLSWLAA